MDLELLRRQRELQQSLGAGNGAAINHLLDVSMRAGGMPGPAMTQPQHEVNQNAAGYGSLSQSAMLVGTVAALQEESGQLRNQWKSDVSRLESELAQLRSAAAWALPHLAEAQNGRASEANLQLLTGAGMERSSSVGAIQQHQAFADRLTRERSMDALLPHTGTIGDHGSLLAREAQRAAELEALLRQNAYAERGASLGGGILAREAERQLEAAMLRQAPGRAPMSVLSEAMLNHKSAPSAASEPRAHTVSSAASEFGRPPSSAAPEQQSVEQTKHQMLELYKELESMTIALQEAKQENGKLKEDKEASQAAHSRDVATLEAMLQQLSADNDQLQRALAKAEESKAKHNISSTPASIRSASVEPAIEPDVESVDSYRMKAVGMHPGSIL